MADLPVPPPIALPAPTPATPAPVDPATGQLLPISSTLTQPVVPTSDATRRFFASLNPAWNPLDGDGKPAELEPDPANTSVRLATEAALGEGPEYPLGRPADAIDRAMAAHYPAANLGLPMVPKLLPPVPMQYTSGEGGLLANLGAGLRETLPGIYATNDRLKREAQAAVGSFDPQPNYDPFSDPAIKQMGYESEMWRFHDSQSPAETYLRLHQMQERDDLARSMANATMASRAEFMVGAMADPTMFIAPELAPFRTVEGALTLGRLGNMVVQSAANAAVMLAAEATKSQLDPGSTTWGGVADAMILPAILGAASGFLRAGAVRARLPDIRPGLGIEGDPLSVLHGAPIDAYGGSSLLRSMGAAIAPGSMTSHLATLLDQEAPVAAFGLEKLPLSPGLRLLMSASLKARQIVTDLVDLGGLKQQKNIADAIGAADKTTSPVESDIARIWKVRSMQALNDVQSAWLETRGKAASETAQIAKLSTRQQAIDWALGGDRLTLGAFGERVAKAVRRGGKDMTTDEHTPAVEKAAQATSSFFNDVRDAAQKVNLFGDVAQRQIKTMTEQVGKTTTRLATLQDELEGIADPEQRLLHQAKIEQATQDIAVLNDRIGKARETVLHGPTLNTAEGYFPRMYDQVRLNTPQGKSEIIERFTDYFRSKGVADAEAESSATRVWGEITRRNPRTGDADMEAWFREVSDPASALGRSLEIPDELIEDFLLHDPLLAIRHQAATMGPAIELTKRFGSADLKRQLEAIRAEHQAAIDAARARDQAGRPGAVERSPADLPPVESGMVRMYFAGAALGGAEGRDVSENYEKVRAAAGDRPIRYVDVAEDSSWLTRAKAPPEAIAPGTQITTSDELAKTPGLIETRPKAMALSTDTANGQLAYVVMPDGRIFEITRDYMDRVRGDSDEPLGQHHFFAVQFQDTAGKSVNISQFGEEIAADSPKAGRTPQQTAMLRQLEARWNRAGLGDKVTFGFEHEPKPAVEAGQRTGFAPEDVTAQAEAMTVPGETGGDSPATQKLTAAMEADTADVQTLRDRLLNIDGAAKDPHTWDQRTIRMLKHYMVWTDLGLSAISQMGDFFRPALTEGLDSMYRHGFATLLDGSRAQIMKMANHEREMSGDALEVATAAHSLSIANIGDTYGSRSAMEGKANRLTQVYFMLNGLNRMTDYTKTWASVIIQGHLNEALAAWSDHLLGKGEAPSEKMMERLRSLSIDGNDAIRMAQQLEQHGEQWRSIRLANSDAWQDDTVRDLYRNALQRALQRTVITPGALDRPTWASQPLGSLISQFKVFGMSSTIRTLYAGLQDNDRQFWTGAAAIVGGGMVLNEMRHELFGSKQGQQQGWMGRLVDGVDRSGILGSFMDGNNAIEALSNNKMGMRPAVGAGRHYPSTPDRMANALFGPTAGKGVEAAGMIGNVMSGNASARDWRKARDFVPGNNLSFLSPAFDAAFPPARPGRHSQTNPAARNPGGPP